MNIDILHCFADHGTEAETLGRYGNVTRVGHKARDTNESEPIRADVNSLPFADVAQFDFGLFHPPCTKWSDMPNANKDGDAPNLIPLSRDVAQGLCDYWVIENKPRAPLDNPTRLTGKMFGLPIEYDRAFESNFEISQPPRQSSLTDTESSSYFYSEKSKAWWASIKGLTPSRYTKHALAKNSLPSAFVDHIMRDYLRAAGLADGPSDYGDYDKRKSAQRSRERNISLEVFSP